MKKLIRDLGLPVEKIDTCKNSCMLYWNDNIDLDYCKFYGEASYLSLTTRLQRLYASEATVEQLTWHANHQTEEGSMYHPSDAEAWRHFDWTYLNFAVELRNVRLGLCTDGFALHRKYSRMHSYWPVILTPYNLPLRMSMSSEYMFVTMVIHDPSNPNYLIDVYLELLIEELQNLWYVGVLTRDNAKNETFMMRVVWMWIVNDLPAYSMASGWSTAGVRRCPVCIEDNMHLICRTLGRRATLTATDSSSPGPYVPQEQESIH
ncbi:UNVERIFIED_CONTAM: hypothetical protein Sradi_4917700 [Sesamum radiatum]|uniref:Uncharacterized protein n=1 Tax=Sesamum radiatum TaxID=300843 RepID=A0AAW2MCS3_SESRA